MYLTFRNLWYPAIGLLESHFHILSCIQNARVIEWGSHFQSHLDQILLASTTRFHRSFTSVQILPAGKMIVRYLVVNILHVPILWNVFTLSWDESSDVPNEACMGSCQMLRRLPFFTLTEFLKNVQIKFLKNSQIHKPHWVGIMTFKEHRPSQKIKNVVPQDYMSLATPIFAWLLVIYWNPTINWFCVYKNIVEIERDSWRTSSNTEDGLWSFLGGCRQKVAVNGHHCDWLDVQSGVPQRSVLGPTRFSLFVSDIPHSSVQKSFLCSRTPATVWYFHR